MCVCVIVNALWYVADRDFTSVQACILNGFYKIIMEATTFSTHPSQVAVSAIFLNLAFILLFCLVLFLALSSDAAVNYEKVRDRRPLNQ